MRFGRKRFQIKPIANRENVSGQFKRNDTDKTIDKIMGLKISTIAGLPENAERSYYLYILDYYNWDEPISNTLRNSFDKIAAFATQNDSVVIQGIPEAIFFRN